MTPQEAFEKALRSIVKQKVPAHVGSRCLYRYTSFEGAELRCAVGHLLTDRQIEFVEASGYLEASARLIVDLLKEQNMPLELEGFDTNKTKDFLREMQRVHDDVAIYTRGSDFVEQFVVKMSAFGLQWGLTVPTDI